MDRQTILGKTLCFREIRVGMRHNFRYAKGLRNLDITSLLRQASFEQYPSSRKAKRKNFFAEKMVETIAI